MKRRTGVTVFGIITLLIVIALVAFYVVNIVMNEGGFEQLLTIFLQENTNMVANVGDLFAGAIGSGDIVREVTAYMTLGGPAIFVFFALIWLIVDLVRRRYIVFGFVAMLLVGCYFETFTVTRNVTVIYNLAAYGTVDMWGFILMGAISVTIVFCIFLFLIDILTGKVKKEPVSFASEPKKEDEKPVYQPVEEEKKEEVVYPYEKDLEKEEPVAEEAAPVEEKKEEPAPEKKAAPRKTTSLKKDDVKEASEPVKKTSTLKKDEVKSATITNEDGKTYGKAYHISRRPELNKWQVKATGSDKALKLFNTQKEAIEYANQLADNQGASIRVHSKEGKIRKAN